MKNGIIDRGDCPGCGRKACVISVKAPKPGSLCTRCGRSHDDLESVVHKLTCGGCAKEMGYKSLLKGEPLDAYVCPDCSGKRLAGGAAPDQDVFVRHTVPCSGGCGKLQGWIDFSEGVSAEAKLEVGYCDDCAAALPPGPEPSSGAVFMRKRMAGLVQALKDGALSEKEVVLEMARLLAELEA